MKLYWVSAIIQNKGNAKPWLLAISEGELTLDAAQKVVDFIKDNHNVLSIWIDTFDENNKKQVVFHECYIDAFGNAIGLNEFSKPLIVTDPKGETLSYLEKNGGEIIKVSKNSKVEYWNLKNVGEDVIKELDAME